MNNRERVIATLNHTQPDHVPWEIGFTTNAWQRMLEYCGDKSFNSKIGNCISWLSTDLPGHEVMPDVWEDSFGVRWDRRVDKDIGAVCNQRITVDTLDAYQFPDPDDLSRYGNYPTVDSGNGDAFFVANLGFSLYERAWGLFGMENFMMSMLSDPAFAHALLDRNLEFNLAIINKACSFGIDAMMFGDDWGTQTGLQMGPELWREFIKPRIRKMYAAVKSHGKYVFIHSCGKVDEVFPDLIECGLDMFNPFQPEVIDVFQAKKQFGKDLCFFGGVSTQKLLPFGTVAQVKDSVKRLIDEIGRDGGYICAPAHGIPGDAKPENVAAMIEVLQAQ